MRYRHRVVLAVLALTLATNGLLLWISYRGSSAILFRQIQSKVLSIAVTTAAVIEGDRHEKIHTRTDETSAEYAQLQQTLRKVRDANRRVDVDARYLYTMRSDGAEPPHWSFVIDAQENDAEMSHVGEPVEFLSEDSTALTLAAPRAENAFSTDKFGSWLSANAPIHDRTGKPVALVGVDIAQSGVVSEMRGLLRSGLFALAISGAVAIGASLLLSHWVSAPLARLKAAVESIALGQLETRVEVRTRDEFGEVGTAINRMAVSLREREMLKGALARYVSHHVAENIIAENKLPDLRGERRRITVLFADIRDFTRFANQLSPEEVVAFLNEYFAEMIDVIFTHQGTLDKMIGDGLMAIFGAPLDDPEHELHAVQAAIEMQNRLAKLRVKWRENDDRAKIACGIGLHTGDAIVGNIGSEQRMDYTAIGDTVNIASRIESFTKEQQVGILLTESTAAGLMGAYALREIAGVQIRGVSGQLTVFAVESEGSKS